MPKLSLENKSLICSWLVGIVGGNFAGLLYVIGIHNASAQIFLVRPSGLLPAAANPTILGVISGLLGQLLFPGILSGISRRYTFWWGLVPIVLYNGWVFVDTFTGSTYSALNTFRWLLLLRIPLVLLISSGPVSLVDTSCFGTIRLQDKAAQPLLSRRGKRLGRLSRLCPQNDTAQSPFRIAGFR